MAHGPKPHPETDASGDTTEFAAVEVEKPERVSYEVYSGSAVSLRNSIRTPVEIQVGQTTESSPLFLHAGRDFPELCEAEGIKPGEAWVLIQPDVFEQDPTLGWTVVPDDNETSIGRATHPQFRLGRDVSRKNHLNLSPPTKSHPDFLILGSSPTPTKVIVDSREHRFLNYEFDS